MSEHPEMPRVRMPRLVTESIDNEFENLQFPAEGREPHAGPEIPSAHAQEGAAAGELEVATAFRSEDPHRIANLMEVLFPGGFRMEKRDDFALFFLFGQLVESLSRFAQSDLADQERIREVSELAARLERLLER